MSGSAAMARQCRAFVNCLGRNGLTATMSVTIISVAIGNSGRIAGAAKHEWNHNSFVRRENGIEDGEDWGA